MTKRENLLIQISTQLVHMANVQKRGPISVFKKTLLGIDNIRDLAEIILDSVTSTLSRGTPLTSAGEVLGLGMNRISTFNLKAGNTKKQKKTLILAGVEALGALGSLGYIQVVLEKQGIMKLNRLDFVDEDNLLFEYFEEIEQVSLSDLPKEDYKYWTHPHKDGLSIVKKMPPSLTKEYTFKKMPKVYDALNAYGSTEFVVNEDLLDIIEEMDRVDHCFVPDVVPIGVVTDCLYKLTHFNRVSEFVGNQAKTWYIKNVTNELHKKGLTTTQIDIRSNSFKKKKASGWLKEKSSDSLNIIRASSKRYEFDRVKAMARIMNDKSFHYDFQLDSRGRFYPVVNYFEPTGSDCAKGLLMFNNGVGVSDKVLDSLAIHTANCLGEDKLSMEDRILYVWVHMDDILEAADDLVNSEWLKQFKGDKKTKFQLMAAVLEWKKYHAEGDDYICHLPIGLDATNSGLQILSALTRDTVGAQETNVINHPTKEIGDAYMVIANSVLDSGFKYKEYEKLDSKAWRKLCKRPTMSYYYDAGMGCIQNQTFEDRREHGVPLFDEMKFADAVEVGKAIYNGVENAFPRQTKAKEALKTGVSQFINSNEGKSLVTWKTFTGFTAFQNYSKIEKSKVKCNFAGKQHQLNYQVVTDKARLMDHKRGISANFVHSQDASLLASVIANLSEEGITEFMMIHDQFSVNAENLDTLLRVFRDTFKSIFKKDQLGATLANFGLTSNPVDYGDLDLNKIKEAKYIIS